MTRLVAVLLCALLVQVTCTPAFAADKRKEGLRLSDDAAKAFKRKEFAEAAALFEKAFRSDPSKPVRLRNAARAYEELGALAEALKRYREYVDVETDETLVAEAKARIRGLEERLAATSPAPPASPKAVASPPEPKPDPVEPPSTPPVAAPSTPAHPRAQARQGRFVPWIVTGAGAAVTLSGVTLGLIASSQRSAFLTQVRNGQFDYLAGETKIRADADAIRSNQTRAAVVMVVGAAIATGGLLWALLGGEVEPAAVTTRPGGLEMAWHF